MSFSGNYRGTYWTGLLDVSCGSSQAVGVGVFPATSMDRPRRKPCSSPIKATDTVTSTRRLRSDAHSGLIKENQSPSTAELTAVQAEIMRLKPNLGGMDGDALPERTRNVGRDEAVDGSSSGSIAVGQPVVQHVTSSPREAAAFVGQPGKTRHLVAHDGMTLNFVAPSIANGIARAVVDEVEVAKLKLRLVRLLREVM